MLNVIKYIKQDDEKILLHIILNCMSILTFRENTVFKNFGILWHNLSVSPTCGGSHLVYKCCTVVLSHSFLLVLWKKTSYLILSVRMPEANVGTVVRRVPAPYPVEHTAGEYASVPFSQAFPCMECKLPVCCVSHLAEEWGKESISNSFVFKNFYIYLFYWVGRSEPVVLPTCQSNSKNCFI